MKKGVVKKCIIFGIVMLFVGTGVTSANINQLNTPTPLSYGNIIYVGGNGTGNYTTIQEAIDNASDGDLILSLIHI
mgnify:CR=1 FL=1